MATVREVPCVVEPISRYFERDVLTDAGDVLNHVWKYICEEIGEEVGKIESELRKIAILVKHVTTSELKYLLLKYIAIDSWQSTLHEILDQYNTLNIEGYQKMIHDHPMMPEDRKEALRIKARKKAIDLEKRIRNLRTTVVESSFGKKLPEWLTWSSVYDAAIQVAREDVMRGDGRVAGVVTEALALEWAKERYPGYEIISGALIHGGLKEKTKGEIDGLVIKPLSRTSDTSTKQYTSGSIKDRLELATSTLAHLESDISGMKARLKKIKLRLKKETSETAEQHNHHDPRGAVHAIIEAKASTGSLHDDWKRLELLMKYLQDQKEHGANFSTMKKKAKKAPPYNFQVSDKIQTHVFIQHTCTVDNLTTLFETSLKKLFKGNIWRWILNEKSQIQDHVIPVVANISNNTKDTNNCHFKLIPDRTLRQQDATYAQDVLDTIAGAIKSGRLQYWVRF